MTKKIVNGTLVDLTQEEEIQRQEEIKTQKDLLEKNKWLENRKLEYPSIADQLDDIYHNGIDGWKETIKAVKDKYPKE